MGLETGSYISALVSTNPVGATDPKSQGDDHIRFIKAKILETFPNINSAVNGTPAELNLVVGATGGLATLSVSFAAATSQIAVLTTALSGFSLSTSVSSADISGTIRTPILTTTGITSGTYTAATVVVDTKGRISGISSNNFSTLTPGATIGASGTSVNFTGIPTGIKRVTVNWSALSSTGTGTFILQIGSSAGLVITGYSGSVTTATTGVGTGNFSAGFIIAYSVAAADARYGRAILERLDGTSNLWTCTFISSAPNTTRTEWGAGSNSLPGALDRLSIITSDTFDAGSVSILYE